MNDESIIGEKTEIAQWVELMDRNLWAVKYLGRGMSESFWNEHPSQSRTSVIIDLKWEEETEREKQLPQRHGYEGCIWKHHLVISFYEDGDEKGRIKSVDARHDVLVAFDSITWFDHIEHKTWNLRNPTETEIREYCKLLDDYTIKQHNGLVQNLVSQLEKFCASKSNELSLRLVHDCCTLEFKYITHRAINFSISELEDIMCYLHFDLGAFVTCRHELKYVLNFINLNNAFGIRDRLDKLKDAYLYRLWKSYKYYHEFSGDSGDLWWEKARWRLEKLLSVDYRELQNGLLLLGCNRVPQYDSIYEFDIIDPCGELVGFVDGFAEWKERPAIPLCTTAAPSPLQEEDEDAMDDRFVEIDDEGIRTGYY